MHEPSVIHNTFVLERNYPEPPKTVFAAFADARKKRRWFAEGDSLAAKPSELHVGRSQCRAGTMSLKIREE